MYKSLQKIPSSLSRAAIYVQNATVPKWAMLDLNQRPPPCKRQIHLFCVFTIVQKHLQSILFPSIDVLHVRCCSGALSSYCCQPQTCTALVKPSADSGYAKLRLSRQALSFAKADEGIHRLKDERPPLTLRLLLSVRHPVNLQPSIV